jgi:hypothetical protein
MPLPNRLTNPGRPLKTHYFGGESDTLREIPPEFRAALDLTVIEIPLPWDQEIVPLSDTVLASKAEQKVTSEWIRRTTYKPPGPVTLFEKDTNKDKQVVTRTRNFKFVGDPVNVPGPFTDVQTKDLGNLHFVESMADSGFVFGNKTTTKEIIDVVPEIFRVLIPIYERKETFTGIVADPQILGSGELYRSETQEDVFNMSRHTKGRGAIGYPVIFTSYKMTPEQQVETITDTLALGSQVLIPTPLMIEGEAQDLGDGSSWLHVGTVPDIFSKLEGETTIPDLIPVEFRGLLPTRTQATTFTGNALPQPVLGPAELSRKEEQLTEFNMRRTTVGRDPSEIPAQKTSYKMTKDKQLGTQVARLDFGLQTIASSINELTVDAEVINLGNNMSVSKVTTVDSLFNAIAGETSIPDLIPSEFKGILPLRSLAVTYAGAADQTPPLFTGELSKREEQLDEFTIRRTTTSRDPALLPASLTSYRVTKDKQIATQTARLATGLQTLTGLIDELTVDAEVINLGSNLSIRKISSVASLFSNLTGETSIPDLIPQEFRGILPLRLSATTMAGTIDPTPALLTGEVSRREEQVDAFTMRRTISSRDTTVLPKHLTNYKITKDKQISTVVATLDIGLQSLTGLVDELTTEAEVTDIGGGLSIMRLGHVGSLFSAKVASTEIPDLIPQEFRGILPTHVEEQTIGGTVVDPPILTTGLFEKTETQVDVYTKRVHTRGRDIASLPAQLTNYKITKDKQIATVVATLDTGLQTLVVNELTTEAEVTDIGGGLSLKRIGSVDTLFQATVASTEVPDLVPPEFRAFLPTYTRQIDVADVVIDPPILSPGDIEKTETQLDVFTKRVRTKGRAGVTLPQTHFNPEVITEFGGGIANKLIKLDVAGTNTITGGLTVLKASITDLGNGMELVESLQLSDAAWPTLFGIEFDKDTQVYAPTEEQVVDPSYTIPTLSYGAVETLKPIDKWRTLRKRITKVPTATGPDNALISYRYHPFQFPGTLDYSRLITYDHKEGYRKAAALLAKHTIKTWWIHSSTPPTVGDGMTVDVKEIITDTVNVPIYSSGDTTRAETYPDVLHDDITNTLGASYPATTPSFTEYYAGTPSGSTASFGVVTSIINGGSGNTVGDVVSISGYGFQVLAVDGSGAATFLVPYPAAPAHIIYVSTVNLGALTGSGITANIYEITYDIPVPGSAWVGTLRVIAADVHQTEVPNQWQVMTESVVMR